MGSLEQQNTILNMIKTQLLELMDEEYNLYKDYNVIIAKEQDFDKHAKNGLKPKTIYIVIKFGGASINYGQTVLPVTFTVLSEQNKCEIAQTLLTDYVNKYNLESNQDLTIKQVYESPSVSSNFNIVYEGYRSILNVTAFFVISENANFFEYYYLKDIAINYERPASFNAVEIYNKNLFLTILDNLDISFKKDIKIKFHKDINKDYSKNVWKVTLYDGENDISTIKENAKLSDYYIKLVNPSNDINNVLINLIFTISFENIPTITKIGSWDAIPDTQPLFNKSNFAETEIKTGHLTFSFTTFLLDNIQIVNDALKIGFKKSSVNNAFFIAMNFKNKEFNSIEKYKLINFNFQQDLGDIPMISLTFGM